MKLLTLLIALIPFLGFSNQLDEYFAKLLAETMQKEEFNNGIEIMETWETMHPGLGNTALAVKASIYFANGELKKGAYYMNDFINSLTENEKQEPLMAFIISSYHKEFINDIVACHNRDDSLILCKTKSGYDQPTGVKVKFWWGLAQTLAGIALMPFNPVAGGALIGSGVPVLIDASCAALDNKSEFERNLQERQKMSQNIQKNSYFPPNKNTFIHKIVI